MNENLANEIRKTIESIKDMKIQVGGINNYLSALEGMIRADYQKKVEDAYQRGYKACMSENDFDVPCTSCDAYQRGLDKAWEAARKIVLNPEDGGLSSTDIFALFGYRSLQSAFKSYSVSEAIAKLKAYEEKQKDDEIKISDEVTDIQSGANFLVTHLWKSNHGDKGVSGFNNDCSAFSATLNKVSKTGRHFDIGKILEAMK